MPATHVESAEVIEILSSDSDGDDHDCHMRQEHRKGGGEHISVGKRS